MSYNPDETAAECSISCVYEYNFDFYLREKSNISELKDLNELSTQEAASSTNNLEKYLPFTHSYAECAIQTRKMETERSLHTTIL